MKKVRSIWEKLTIKNKIRMFTTSVFVAIAAALLFDVWIVRLFVMDFNEIMEANSKCGEIVAALNRETDYFDEYVRSTGSVSEEDWTRCTKQTYDAIYGIPLTYTNLGDNRYAQLQALRLAYDKYCSYRNQVISEYHSEQVYVKKLYDVYAMQKYLSLYAQRLVDMTMEEGNARYRQLLPVVFRVPFIAAGLSVVLFYVVLQISRLLNRSVTAPVQKLASASRKIAANDYFIDDVVVDNKDELGEMVSAFNKMKFATGEYIRAMEERREALDELHAREMEKLEIEKQLETMNLELLKSQINPHFLFNTLNVIAGTANLEGASTTERMTEALSSLFRYNLKTHTKESLLSQELKISGDYMYLQKMRFGSRVEYEVSCEVDEGSVIVPTFTFQPLLENAIVHGISPKVEGGKVSVAVRKKAADNDSHELSIEVSDTGVGMDMDTLSKIRQQLQLGETPETDKDLVGIGLGNINRRIRAMYESAALEIDSQKDVGTTIRILIPLQGGAVN